MPALIRETTSNDSAGTAQLRSIKCSELQDENPDALANLLLAATEDGIFYLDFEDSHHESKLSRSVQDVGRLNRAIFDMPLENKLLYDVDLMGELKLNGYKPIGRNKGGIKDHRDGFESYGISHDTIASASSSSGVAVRHPAVVAEHQEALAGLTSTCLEMTQLILRALSRGFGLPNDQAASSSLSSSSELELSHKSGSDSASSPLSLLRVLKYPNAIGGSNGFSIPQLAHADMGSLTFLFTESPGLQILAGSHDGQDNKGRWLDVAPPSPGRQVAIVNFGDAIKILSGGSVKSVLHRVVTVPGGHDEERNLRHDRDRYSFAFLVRPAVETRMEVLPCFRRGDDVGIDGGEDAMVAMTCEEWVSMRFSQLRAK